MPGIRGAAGGGRRKRGRPPLRRHSARHTTSDEVADQEAQHASDDNTDHDDTRRTRSTRKRPRSGRRSATPANDDSETKRRKEEAIKQEQAAYESEKDEDGEQKVDKEGRLQGGREYKVPTFTLPTRGDQVFMFAMEPARLLNYRDSYLFFHKNPELERARLTEDERNWLVDQRLLVHWFRNRDVAVVSARSCYKRFGHRVVKKGRRIIDDYFEARAREEGIPEGEEEESESAAAADGMTSMGRRALISRSIRSSDYSANTPITNSTWMHHAALAVRGFNAQLHERRAEKAGFYDIHTNIQQIAASTQPTHCNFECVDSSSKKEFNVSDLQFDEKPASSVVRGIGSDLLDYDIEKVLESVADHDDTRELVKARIDALKVDLEPKAVDDDDKNYPIAVMDGQYQGSFPIHYTRFKQQDPKLAPPSALTSTAQSIIAQQHYFSQMYQIMNQSLASYNDQQQLHHHQQPMHHQPTPTPPPPPPPQHHIQTPPSAPIQPRPMMHHAQPSPPISSQPPSRQPILRVVPPVERRTCSVESCKQPVMFPGERCQLHASQTGTPPQHPIIQRGPPPATTYADNKCGECHYLSAPSEQLSKDGKDACDAFHMIKCAKCTRKYHPACVHLKTPRQVAAAESYPWACAECKICCVCKSAGDESKLMICDDCDRGWHTDCCNPPVEKVPEGSWLCPLCADCHGCDEHGSEKEYKHAVVPPTADRNKYPIYLATFCNKCHNNFENDRYCPVCLRTFSEEEDNDDEDNEMVACDQCDHWIHTGCDETLTPERYQALCDDEDAKYLCPLCADSVKPIHQTTAATMALKSQAPPSGVTVGIVGGKVRTRGIVRYKDHKIAAPEINGTGIAEMPSLSSK